jgi:transposase
VSEIELLRSELESTRGELLALREALEKATTDREQYRALYMKLLERCRLLERGIVAGKKTERFQGDDEAQLSMHLLGMLLGPDELERSAEENEDGLDDALAEALEEEVDDDAGGARPADTCEPRRRRRGRRKLPEALPRVEVEVLPPEVLLEGLSNFERIGEVVSETVERRPGAMVVARVVRPKYVRKSDPTAESIEAQLADETPEAPTVMIAPPPDKPIERGLAGPGLLAHTIVLRWGDHMPANRQEAIHAREGLPLSRKTICSWHLQLADLVEPLVDAMMADAFLSPYVCVDATGVLVQAPEQCQRAHFWVLVAPGRHVLYRFSEKHDIEAVDRLLAGYEGYLVSDAATVYDHLYRDGAVVEVACWAHCRRYFFKALGTEPELARHALGLIRKLFKIEEKLADESRKRRESVRRKLSAPIVDDFFAWCEKQAEVALDGSPIAAALNYAINQKAALRRFLDDGRLPLHNNISERALRREAVGRKNWLFVGSDDGARANTLFVSLLASCQMHGIEPLGYLRDLLCLLPSWPRPRVLELAPASWQETLKQPEAQQLLAANVFRRIALGEHPTAM